MHSTERKQRRIETAEQRAQRIQITSLAATAKSKADDEAMDTRVRRNIELHGA